MWVMNFSTVFVEIHRKITIVPTALKNTHEISSTHRKIANYQVGSRKSRKMVVPIGNVFLLIYYNYLISELN
jgi:hypothetical protein